MVSHQESAQVRSAPAASPAARRILIVDDEPMIRSFIGCALAAAGYLPDFAVNGTQALAQLLECRYDLVILDLVMPDMDGACVLDRVLSVHPDQAVIVVSCVSDVVTKLTCLERGAGDYLTKPFSLAELLARVRVQLRDDAPLLSYPASYGDGVLQLAGLVSPLNDKIVMRWRARRPPDMLSTAPISPLQRIAIVCVTVL